MGFIDQQQVMLVGQRKEAGQLDPRVKGVIVIADDDITIQGIIEGKLKRADLMAAGRLGNVGRTAVPSGGKKSFQRCGQIAVIVQGQRTFLCLTK